MYVTTDFSLSFFLFWVGHWSSLDGYQRPCGARDGYGEQAAGFKFSPLVNWRTGMQYKCLTLQVFWQVALFLALPLNVLFWSNKINMLGMNKFKSSYISGLHDVLKKFFFTLHNVRRLLICHIENGQSVLHFWKWAVLVMCNALRWAKQTVSICLVFF